MAKKALITGVTGQDGAYLAEFLLDQGYEVHGIKRRSSLFNTDRIDHLYQDPHESDRRFILHYGDMTDSTSLIRVMQKVLQPNEVYNLAAQSHVAVSFEEPEYTANAGALGTLRLLEAIRILGLEKTAGFYHASNSELYDLVQESPQRETTPFYPRSPYAVAKLYTYWITVNYRESYMGLTLQAQGKNDEAVSRFEAALKQAPGAAEPLTALVKNLLARGQTAPAEQRIRAELARTPNNVMAHNLLGEVLLLQKKTDAAIAALGEAERLNPRLATPYRNLAAAQLTKGADKAAVAILQKGIAATNHEPSLVFTLSAYQESRERPDQAIALYEEALHARPKEAMFINNLAMLLTHYRKDKKDLDRAVDLGERLKARGNPTFLDTLGWAYYRRGDMTAAIPVLESAACQAANSALLNYHLGMAYYQKGDHDTVRRHLEKVTAAKVPYHGAEEAKATLAKLAKS